MKFENKSDIVNFVRRSLAKVYNCDENIWNNDGINFIEYSGRKSGNQDPFLQFINFQNCIAIIGDKAILEKIKPYISDKSREEIFEFPLIYGLTIFCISDPKSLFSSKTEYKLGWMHDNFEQRLPKSFEYVLDFDSENHCTTKIVHYAEDNGKIIAAASACLAQPFDDMYSIGIEVLPEYRNKGLGTTLVNNLTQKLLSMDVLPYYKVASSNVASLATAYKSNFIPLWCESYKNILDGSSSFNNLLNDLIKKFKN